MDDLPLSRGDDGETHLAGTAGLVSLETVYDCILGTGGGQGAVFVGKVLSKSDSRVLMQVSMYVCIFIKLHMYVCMYGHHI